MFCQACLSWVGISVLLAMQLIQTHTIANNLNAQSAKHVCGKGKFEVRGVLQKCITSNNEDV